MTKQEMTIQSLVLFAHVVAVIALFSGLILEWLALDAVRRSAALLQGMPWMRLSLRAQRALGIAFGVTLLSGFYLGSRVGVLRQGWMLSSYSAMLLIGVSGGLVARRLIRPIRLAVENPTDLTYAAVHASMSAWLPLFALRIRVALAMAIVYLMIGKPEAGISMVIVAIAVVSAMLGGLQNRRAPSPSIHQPG